MIQTLVGMFGTGCTRRYIHNFLISISIFLIFVIGIQIRNVNDGI